jgi:hypothetical protein
MNTGTFSRNLGFFEEPGKFSGENSRRVSREFS